MAGTKSMKLSDYFQIKSPVYVALKIIPHSSIRNYNSSTIARMICDMYRSIRRSIHIVEKKLILETSVKCSYIIDITKTDVSFYFIVPKQYKMIAKEKIVSVWPRATILDSEVPRICGKNITTYQLQYKNLDAFSLAVDKKSNSVLNSTLNVIDIMDNGDRVSICYNFLPTDQQTWKNYCKSQQRKYLNGDSISKVLDIDHIYDTVLGGIIRFLDSILDGLGGEISKGSPLDQLREVLGTKKREISELSMKKSNSTMLETQIAIVSSSNDKNRSVNNASSVCQGFHCIDADNELISRKSNNINLLEYKYKDIEPIKVSVDECQNFLQLPGRELLEEHNIKHINVLETKIPEELTKGYIKIGKSTFKGNTVQTYFSYDKEIANLPIVFVGPMGAGKTFENKEYAKGVIASGEGLVCIDYIKNCELSEEIEKITPKDRLVVLDMSKEECLQAFAFNEFKLKGHTPYDIMKCANNHQQEITALIDAVYPGDPLSGQMRKFFTSAADIVLINNNMSLRDVVSCLEDYEARDKFIKRVPEAYMNYLGDKIKTLRELDEIDKNSGEVTGTKYSKIEHILDRINSLRETFEMMMMYNKPSTNNLDFSKAMDEGKIILIKMRSDDFRSEHVKNVLATFFISKIWLACNMRGEQKELRRCHVLLDEIFQAPTAYKPLRLILKQCRKFRLRLVFTAQMLGDLGDLSDGLKSAGASYVLMQKSDKENFLYLEQEFKKAGFTVDDLLNLKRYHALNLISYSGGYAAYESDLEVK